MRHGGNPCCFYDRHLEERLKVKRQKKTLRQDIEVQMTARLWKNSMFWVARWKQIIRKLCSPSAVLILICVHGCFACMCAYAPCVHSPQGGQKVASAFPELEDRELPCGCWEWAQVLWKGSQGSSLLSHLSCPGGAVGVRLVVTANKDFINAHSFWSCKLCGNYTEMCYRGTIRDLCNCLSLSNYVQRRFSDYGSKEEMTEVTEHLALEKQLNKW